MDHREMMLMNFRPSAKQKTIQSHITIEDVSQVYPAQTSLTDFKPRYSGEVIAFGRAVYAYAVYWPLCNAFQTEKESGRRFDWFVWKDDDAIVTIRDWNALMAVADPAKMPFVAALGYDRLPHYRPAVSEVIDGEQRMWLAAPKSGTYPVLTTGLVFAVFHRSLFEKVPEPWFGVSAPIKGSSGVAPDWWWSYRLHAAGITPYVCCDTNVIHQGRKLYVNRAYSEKYTRVCDDNNLFESEYIKPENRVISDVSGAVTIPVADVRDGRQD